MNTNIKKIIIIGMLVACQIITGRFLTISTPFMKIGFTFLPIAISAILYGPVWAGIGAAIGDIITAMLLPYGYFPGFTVSAFVTGAIYGFFLYRKSLNIWKITGCVLVINIAVSIFLQTYWIYLLTGQGYLVVLPMRIIQNAITTPIQIFGIRLIAYRVAKMSCDLHNSHNDDYYGKQEHTI